MNDSPFVVKNDVGSVRWLTLSQPGRKNAVPSTGWAEISDAIGEFATSSQRVLVVKGDGDSFCSGADLNVDQLDELRSPAVGREFMQGPARAATALHRVPKPTIAAVDGVAVGAGMNLALGCDIVVATTRASFAEVFVKRGLALDFGGTWLLPRVAGGPSGATFHQGGAIAVARYDL
jgi:2-(1,2-epoxy-1,2-dihydrophenyl)acetyl-CoA isomerase